MMVRLFIMKKKVNFIVELHNIVKTLMVMHTNFSRVVICATNHAQLVKMFKQFGIQLKKKTFAHLINFVHKLKIKFIREIQPA